jgi:hypothetical protein
MVKCEEVEIGRKEKTAAGRDEEIGTGGASSRRWANQIERSVSRLKHQE